MTINLDEISKLLSEANTDNLSTQYVHDWYDRPAGMCLVFCEGGERKVLGALKNDGDAKLFIAAPTIIKELVERVRKLERQKVVNYPILGHEDRLVGGRNPFTPGYTKKPT